MNLRLVRTPSLVLVASLSACGSLDGNPSQPSTLAHMQGMVVNPQSVAVGGANVRVAIVWQAVGGGFALAEDLPVQPVFPASFTIDINEPPPASAMADADADFSTDFGAGPTTTLPGPNGAVPTTDSGIAATGPSGAKGSSVDSVHLTNGGTSTSSSEVAFGTVVAYLDKNGNGKLDLVPDGASGYIDQILATNESDLIVYFQGPIPAAAADQLGHMPVLGYNVLSGCSASAPVGEDPGSICTQTPDAGASTAACNVQWLSIAAPLTLTASTDPRVDSLMCLRSDGSSSTSQGSTQALSGRPKSYPDPCDPKLSCFPDGSGYDYTTCETIQEGLCEGTDTSCTSISYQRPDPVPSDWPCKA